MDFFDVIDSRGSYRGEFLDEPVPEADIRKIIGAGIKAPSGYNQQTTTFMAVTDEKIRREIAGLMPTPATSSAPLILVVLSERVVAHEGLSFEFEDYGAATENMMLAITALGYAGVWMDGMVKLHGNREKLHALLHVPAGKTVRTIVPVGRPKDAVVQREKRSFEERAVIL